MSSSERVYLAVCAAIAGYCLAHMFADFGRWPRLTYFPYERTWAWFRSPPGPVPMNYLGNVFWGLVGAASCGLAVWLGCRLVKRAPSERLLYLAGGWALTAAALAALYFFWNLWPLS